jgi:hypothetical protein
MTALLHANDNAPFTADFSRIPALFLKVYGNELMGWAKELTKGNQCTIDLWNPPGATIISAGWQGQLTLQYDAYGDPVTKRMKFVIRGATEEDERRLREHCDVLPGIMEQHRVAAQAKQMGRPKVARWVFDGTVPDYFVERYQDELRAWANNLVKVGREKHIVLREGVLADLSPDEEMGAQLIRVTLVCKIERVENDEVRIVVSAADDEQEWLIARHCEKMRGANVPARMVLVEPERPFMPFMPKVE